jgi:Ca2+:H+ antiporter
VKYLYPLLLLWPVALALDFAHGSAVWIFLASAGAIIPLSAILGRATEEVAGHSGPAVGGFLNATLGNAAELIITLFALQRGLVELVKASIIGSILGNLLLVLGLAILAGGLRHKTQTFSSRAAGTSASMMMLAVAAMVLPALFSIAHPLERRESTLFLSEIVAGVLIVAYALSLVFTLHTHRALLAPTGEVARHDEEPDWTMRRAVTVLIAATIGVGVMSELLVGATEETMAQVGVSELFVGIIVIPMIGNAAEHASAVWMAAKNKMDLAIGIAIGSSTQIALFVAPVLVFAGMLMGAEMDFVFTTIEVIAIALTTGIITIIALDGESNWFEGVQLLSLYVILAATFFFY